MKKYCLHILLVFTVLNSLGQITDTTVFLGENGLIESKIKAERILSLTQVSKMTFVQKNQKRYSDKNESYFDNSYLEIRDTYKDSIYYLRTIYESCCGRQNYHSDNENKVVYRKKGETFQLSIYNQNDKLIRKGTSLLLAPIIWDGEVEFFNDEGSLRVKRTFKQGVQVSIDYFDSNGDKVEEITKTPEKLPEPKNDSISFDKFITKYIAQNYKYPKEAKSNFQMPTIYVGFIVSTEGKIESLHYLKGENDLFNSYIENLIYGLPEFKPASVKGEKVNYLFYLPIRHYID